MREQIINEIKTQLEERVAGAKEVNFTVVKKNNGVELQAVTLKPIANGMTVYPTIYIDGMIEAIAEDDMTVEEAVEEIIRIDGEHKDSSIGSFFDNLDKDKILENTTCQLVNRENNKELLEIVPHKDVCDLAIVYRCVVETREEGTGSFVIRNDFMKKYDITVEELDDAAKKNEEFTVRSIAEVMEEMMGMPAEEMPEMDNELWVLTNKRGVNGATVMTSEVLSGLAEKLNDDLYILPSSIHEVLAIKAGNKDVDELRQMVSEVNDTQVSKEERLSYNVYKYSREDRGLMIA